MKRHLKIDFRTKMLMTIVLPICLLVGNLPGKNLLAAMLVSFLPCFLMLIEKKFVPAIRGIILIFLAVLVQKYLMNVDLGFFNAFVMLFTMTMLRMLPGLLMGQYAYLTTDMSELIFSLKKMHLSDHLVIPVTVMSRFFYTTAIDYKQIKDAMYLDGLTFKRLIFHPIKFISYRIIPLLMVLTRTSDEITTSAISRGLEVGQKRTHIFDNKFKFIDLVCLLLVIGIIVLTWGDFYA